MLQSIMIIVVTACFLPPSLSLSLSLFLSFCLSVCPSARLSVCPSARLSVCRSACPSVCPSVALSLCRSVGSRCLSTYLPAASIYLPNYYLYTCIYPSMRQYMHADMPYLNASACMHVCEFVVSLNCEMTTWKSGHNGNVSISICRPLQCGFGRHLHTTS